MAAVLACGPGATLSHRSAARLWGLHRASNGSIEVTRARGWRGPAAAKVHRATLRADERTVVNGIPVTTVPRTIFDLAAVVSRQQLERSLNEAEIRGLTDALSIPNLLDRYPRRPGSAALRALLDDGAASRGAPYNDFEERFVAFLDRHSFPRPRLNADVAAGGRFFSADCLWHDRRLIVELDGRAVHGTEQAFEKDRERDRILLTAGWRVLRVTWRQLHDDEVRVAADLRLLFEHER